MSLRYKNGKLQFGAGEKAFCLEELSDGRETPFYVYDLSGMEEEVQSLKSSLGDRTQIHYAVKANSHPKILQKFAEWGLGADVVSAGEARLALEAGIPASKIIFSGVAKTKKEILFALEYQIGQINVESPSELRRIGQLALEGGYCAKVAFRINPNVNPQTHPYITTGFKDNKFGMEEEFLPELLEILSEFKTSLCLQGLTIHIGSQLQENKSIEEAIEKTIPLFLQLKEKGYKMKTFDVGGGIGIDYQNGGVNRQQVAEYGEMVRRLLKPLDVDIYCEPGRVLVGAHGILVGQVQYIKKTQFKNFVILNTGMHHLMRPALYQAYHRIFSVKENRKEQETIYDVVGPICESSDFLGKERSLKEIKEGDSLVISEAGAYGRSMASQYNAHEYPDELVFYQGKPI